MSTVDHILQRVEQLFRVNIVAIGLGMLLCIGAVTYHGVVVQNKVTHQELDQHYTYLYQLLTRHAALWDRWIRADELEKQLIQMQLDSIRSELNKYYVLRSTMRGRKLSNESFYEFKIYE